MALVGVTEPWYFPSANKASADELLVALNVVTGAFLVRKHKDPSKYVISVMFKGKPTHHLGEITDGQCYLNQKPIDGISSVTGLISKLKSDKVKGWPILLTESPPNDAAGGSGGGSSSGEIAVTIVNTGGFGMTLANKGHGTFVLKTKSGGAAEKTFAQNSIDFKVGLRIKSINGNNVLDKPKAEAVSHMKGNAKIDVVFVVDAGGYASTLAAASNPTSPNVSQPTSPQKRAPPLPTTEPPQTIEEKPSATLPRTSSTSESDEKVPPYEDQTASSTTVPEIRPGPVAGVPQWLHEYEGISRSKADALLTAAGAADGLFLVRRKGETQFAIDFISGNRISHHLVKPHPSSALLCVHDDETLTAPTLNDIVAMLQENIPDHWPYPLTSFVPVARQPSDPPFKNLADYISNGSPPTNVDAEAITETESKPMEGMDVDMTAMSDSNYATVMPHSDNPVTEVGARIASEDETRVVSAGLSTNTVAESKRRNVLPAVEAARKELHEAVQVLSAPRQDKLHEALAKYVNRKWSTSDLVIVVDQILESLDEPDRVNIVENLERLLPSSQQDAFRVMLSRVKVEREFDQVIERTPLELHAELARLVTGVLKRVRSDTRRPEDISSFERRVQLASTQRGFAVVTMQGEEGDSPFAMEEIAKAVHVGWARSVISTWAPEYGIEPIGELVFTKGGALDTFNFTSVQGLQIYQQRVALANQRYVLSTDMDKSSEFHVPEAQKHLYRVTAEILIDCYLKLHPKDAKRQVIREDRFAYIELKQLNLIGKPPQPKALPPPPQGVFARGGSLAGRGGALNFKVSLPGVSFDENADDNNDAGGAFFGGAEESPPWFHGVMDKNMAVSLLQPEQEMTFLVRERPNLPGFALDFKFQHTVTHHLVSLSEDERDMLIGGKVVVPGATTIGDVITGLYLPQQGWPAPLKAFVPRDGAASKAVVETQKRLSAVFDDYTKSRNSQQRDDVDWDMSTAKVHAASFEVLLEKGGGPLGMSLVGPTDSEDERVGVFITKIKEGSTAFATGQITPGLRIMAINGTDLEKAHKADVAKCLKVEQGTRLDLTLRDDRGGYNAFQQLTKKQRTSDAGGQDVYGVVTEFPTGLSQRRSTDPPSDSGGDHADGGGGDDAGDVHVTVEKQGSFGMSVLNSGGLGNFIGKATANGAAATAFDAAGLSISQGLRIVSINGTDLLNEAKATCMEILKSATVLEMVIRRDVDGWAATHAKREANLQQKQSASSLVPMATAPPPSLSSATRTGDEITAADVGLRVTVTGYDCGGVLRFVGPHHINGTMKGGIELDEALGKNNGTIKGHEYFQCVPKFGAMCNLSKVTVYPDGEGPSTSQSSGSSDEVRVTFVKGNATGYGCTLIGDSNGAYVGQIRPGSVAEAALGPLGVTASDGLRFVSVNGAAIQGKSDAASQMKGTTQVDIVFAKDPAGHAAAESKKKMKSSSDLPKQQQEQVKKKEETKQPQLASDEVSVQVIAGSGGFGMKLASVGDGTYVASVKPGGAAEAVFGGHGLSADQGLRFKSVNGVDVFAEPKSACISQMKNVSSIDIVFKKDVAGFSKATASKPKPSAAPPPSTGGVEASDFDNMGRLAIIKHLRSKNIDYSQATNLEELRALGKSSSSSSASPPKAKRQTQTPEDTYEVPPQKQASKAQVPGSDIDNMGRLALIKMLRGMGVDYSQAKSIEELRALAKSSGSGGKEKEPKKAKGKAGKTPKIGTKWNTKLDRVASTKVLMSAGVAGGFLVRPSARSSSGLSLSVFQEGQVSNFNILLEGGQLKMANSPTAFKKIEDFILHYVQDADGAFAQPLVVLPQFK